MLKINPVALLLACTKNALSTVYRKPISVCCLSGRRRRSSVGVSGGGFECCEDRGFLLEFVMMIKASGDKFITIDGLELIRKKHSQLEDEMAACVKVLQDARAHGDLSENAEYKAALADFERIQLELGEVKDVLHDHVVAVTPPDVSVVRFGASVCLQDQATNEQCSFRIGSKIEARLDGDTFRYFRADLPSAVLTKPVGSTVSYNDRNYKIVDVQYSTAQRMA